MARRFPLSGALRAVATADLYGQWPTDRTQE
ncbi:MAG: hypothetical protein ACI9M6_000998, partial [Hydrogenophaga sp.]